MSIAAPIITFKAGICDLDTSANPPLVKPKDTPGYIYLYSEDDLIHFCWRPRSAPLTDPEVDLVMVPSDGTFAPYRQTATNGRIFVLKFLSSSQRYLFWLQSKSQHEQGDLTWFSPRDLKLGEIVNSLLQGEEVDVETEIANIPRNEPGDGDDDATMEDVEGTHHGGEHRGSGSGGAGFDATGGDIREEGEESREGGADGGRAATVPQSDPSSVIQGLLQSLQGNQNIQSPAPENLFTTLADLLSPSSTIPMVESADDEKVNNLLNFLPPSLLLLAQDIDDIPAADINAETAQAVLMSLDLSQRKDILKRVLRSPQFTQSLASLTVALRDGGLPSISEALKIKVENGGFVRRGGVPLGGGDAVEAFMDGVHRQATGGNSGTGGDTMETDQS
ncbi:proteasome complex subunit Rpn13 ubiquitin receptor-domain-containing protein [Talaromyces proteolyticus]|uniref:Proteasome complex subunit Rpn13 ubiquitin receptor-domain-containing protein n=1 Tax=Talaromyces proteolyticus TaxID=1131652 RepID=A0AAD4KUM4_9EURO|nr:proteasome complex subunit Rpn13 ubiquitin receptor-domain-containing protein [Talaromyces proteolyticus]KAH8697360.1 proteasome complex subunit Rpn13 ubiquitin receptor-domain-containing protein [Talaromyces proteolyticus]